jgi:hypothetical protein
MKTKNNLQKIFDIFFTNTDFLSKKILFIDDECDYASINQPKRNAEETAIFGLLARMYSKIKYGKILYVTATPFANILVDRDNLDRMVILQHYEKYCGLHKYITERDLNNFIKVNVEKSVMFKSEDIFTRRILTNTLFI